MSQLHHSLQDWPAVWFAFFLPVGLFIRAGSAIWTATAGLFLAFAGLMGLALCLSTSSISRQGFWLFDRTVAAPEIVLLPIFFAILLTSAALLVLLIIDRSNPLPSAAKTAASGQDAESASI